MNRDSHVAAESLLISSQQRGHQLHAVLHESAVCRRKKANPTFSVHFWGLGLALTLGPFWGTSRVRSTLAQCLAGGFLLPAWLLLLPCQGASPLAAEQPGWSCSVPRQHQLWVWINSTNIFVMMRGLPKLQQHCSV